MVATKDTTSCLKYQVQPLLQAREEAFPAAERVFHTHQDRLNATETKLSKIINDVQALVGGLLAATRAKIVQEAQSA